MAVAQVGGKIYFIGGTLIPSDAISNLVEAYDPATDTWTSKAPMRFPRELAASAVLAGKIYVVGGEDDTNTRSELEVYNPATDSWSTLPAMPRTRSRFAAVAAGSTIIAFPGFQCFAPPPFFPPGPPKTIFCGQDVNVFQYDPAANSWIVLVPLSVLVPQAPLCSAIAETIGTRIYLLGRRSAPYSSGCEGESTWLYAFDPASVVFSPKSSSLVSRGVMPGHFAINGRMYVFGGQASDGTFLNSMEEYDPVTDSWSYTAAVLPEGKTFIGATSLAVRSAAGGTGSGSPQSTWIATSGGGSANVSMNNLLLSSLWNPIPSLASVAPATVPAGASSTAVALKGAGLTPASTVQWNGQPRATTVDLATGTLTITLTSADLSTPGYGTLTAVNPPPGGGTSNPLALQVSPAPAVVPQTGWWWNPNLSGMGFFIEAGGKSGTGLFLGGYMFDPAGNPTWLVSTGPVSGATYTGSWLKGVGGQTLTGTYRPPAATTAAGLKLTFTSPATAVLTRPDNSTIGLQRFSFTLSQTPQPPLDGAPQIGWWWPDPGGAAYGTAYGSGTGFGIEIQGITVFIVAYAYDTAGNPVWYLATGILATFSSYNGNWIQYRGGPQLTDPGCPANCLGASAVSPPASAMTLNFADPTHATLTMGSVTIPITRFREF